jgi:hypothetical protein
MSSTGDKQTAKSETEAPLFRYIKVEMEGSDPRL